MKTIDWYGIVAWINWPTSDGRWNSGTVVARHQAPVLWRRSLEGEAQVVGVVRQVAMDMPDPEDQDSKIRPVRALLRLEVRELAGMTGTLYPEVNCEARSSTNSILYNPVITAITLGHSPAWSNLDPVIRDSGDGLYYA